MPTTPARRPAATPKLVSPPASDVIRLYAERNPDVARTQVEPIGKLVAAFGATAAKLSPNARKVLLAREKQLVDLIEAVVAKAATAEPLVLKPKTSEVSEGQGLGVQLSAADGASRLAAYATPMSAEAWAGPLAGATELQREFGISRSTLHLWQKQGAVIGVQVGVSKHAFPVEQFIDARPVAGLAPVVQAVGQTRTAWRWLREPNPGLDGAAPLDRLKAGELDRVVDLARSNFDQA